MVLYIIAKALHGFLINCLYTYNIIYEFHVRMVKKQLQNICYKVEVGSDGIENHALELCFMSWKYINNIRSSGKSKFQALAIDLIFLNKQAKTWGSHLPSPLRYYLMGS